MPWDEGFWDVVNDESGEFIVNYDDEGKELPDDQVRIYYRPEISGRRITSAYNSKLTLLEDKDGDATIDESELEHYEVTYWDFGRITQDENEQDFTEYLFVEMDDETKYFELFRGKDILPSDIMVF